MPVLLYGLLVLVPAGVLLSADRALRRFCRFGPRPARRSTSAPSLERLTGRLRSLEEDYRRISTSDLPARARRLRSVALAYDDTLSACCLALGLPAPRAPLPALVRLETEAELARAGITW